MDGLDELKMRIEAEKANAARTPKERFDAAAGAGAGCTMGLSGDMSGTSGKLGPGLGHRGGLRERLSDKRRSAQVQSRKLEALNELDFLLNKNPEVARILDLLDEIGG